MLPIDPGDDRDVPVQPAQAMAHGSTIIRPGAVAWGGSRDAPDGAYPSIEGAEQLLAAVASDPGQLGALLAELTRTRLLVPLPAGRPFTDGSAVVLPTVRSCGADFIPCFTSVQRLEAWVNPPWPPASGRGQEPGGGLARNPAEFDYADEGRRWRRAGDSRELPHIVVPAAALAGRLPPGIGLVINPDTEASLPLYPECAAYLARLPGSDPDARAGEAGTQTTGTQTTGTEATGIQATSIQVGEPPAEPVALLREALAGLRAVPAVRRAARAWLTVPGHGEGLVISVTLDDPASDGDREAVIAALTRAMAGVPLQAPFPVDVTFPGEPSPDAAGPGETFTGEAGGTEVIDAWVAANAHPFYTRD